MTDRELMQQALDALTAYDGTNGASQRKRVLTALRERLAQPEHDYRTRYDRGCYKCGSHYCHANCPEPTHLAPQQPQIQPCAGRNCGSTNPNLHSAECFEDYEKATGMAQPEQEPVAWEQFHEHMAGPFYTTPPQRTWVGLTDDEVVHLKMLGRDLEFVSMTALRRFTRDIEAKLREKNT